MRPKSDERQARERLIDSLEVGDLIRLNSLTRVVRGIKVRSGRVMSITLSIQRVTWTRRPYTVVNRADLYTRSLKIVQKGYGLGRTELEMKLQEEIDARFRDLRMLGPHDVIGRVF